jgi:ankyrin repeat protein
MAGRHSYRPLRMVMKLLSRWAVRNGHEAIFKILLEKGAEVDSNDKYGQMLLLWAAENGHEAIVKILLEKGAEVDSKNKYSQTSL